MFKHHREEETARAQLAARHDWEQQRADLVDELELARDGQGATEAAGFILKAGEQVFALVSDAALIEERRGASEWKGRSSGVSVPVYGRVRVRVGQSRGHLVQAAPTPTAIDKGSLLVTDRRAVFQGTAQTRECLWSKLVAVRHDADATTFSVSNRQKPTRVFYGAGVGGTVQFRIDLAIAVGNGTRDAFVARLQQRMDELDAHHPPAAPAAVAPAAEQVPAAGMSGTAPPVGPAPGAPLPPAGWYPDPGGQSAVRWWDGSRWTDSTRPMPGPPA